MMPQLDPKYFSSQIFWMFISFGILWIGVQFWLYPIYKKGVLNRQERIQAYEAEIHGLTKETEDLNRTYEEKLAFAKSEAKQKLKQAKQDAYERLHNLEEGFIQQHGVFLNDLEKQLKSQYDVENTMDEEINLHENYLEKQIFQAYWHRKVRQDDFSNLRK